MSNKLFIIAMCVFLYAWWGLCTSVQLAMNADRFCWWDNSVNRGTIIVSGVVWPMMRPLIVMHGFEKDKCEHQEKHDEE